MDSTGVLCTFLNGLRATEWNLTYDSLIGIFRCFIYVLLFLLLFALFQSGTWKAKLERIMCRELIFPGTPMLRFKVS